MGLEELRREWAEGYKTQKLLRFLQKYDNTKTKIKSFYDSLGNEELKKFVKNLSEKTENYFSLHFDEEKGLTAILIGDTGLELDRKEFTWANEPPDKIKKLFLEILGEYKRILDNL